MEKVVMRKPRVTSNTGTIPSLQHTAPRPTKQCPKGPDYSVVYCSLEGPKPLPLASEAFPPSRLRPL